MKKIVLLVTILGLFSFSVLAKKTCHGGANDGKECKNGNECGPKSSCLKDKDPYNDRITAPGPKGRGLLRPALQADKVNAGKKDCRRMQIGCDPTGPSWQ